MNLGTRPAAVKTGARFDDGIPARRQVQPELRRLTIELMWFRVEAQAHPRAQRRPTPASQAAHPGLLRPPVIAGRAAVAVPPRTSNKSREVGGEIYKQA